MDQALGLPNRCDFPSDAISHLNCGIQVQNALPGGTTSVSSEKYRRLPSLLRLLASPPLVEQAWKPAILYPNAQIPARATHAALCNLGTLKNPRQHVVTSSRRHTSSHVVTRRNTSCKGNFSNCPFGILRSATPPASPPKTTPINLKNSNQIEKSDKKMLTKANRLQIVTS